MTHTINKIRFGDEFSGNPNQLDGETRVIADGYGMYQYYLKVRVYFVAIFVFAGVDGFVVGVLFLGFFGFGLRASLTDLS